jgi:hypothetical protein
MRGWALVLLAAVVAAACKSQPKVDQQLEADALLFCRAWEAKGRPQLISDISGYLLENIKSKEILDVFSNAAKEDDPRATFKQLRLVFAKAGVVHCTTLDWLEARYEHSPH